jgi:hypothetical protein
MKQALLALALLAAVVGGTTAAAGAGTVSTVLTGKCTGTNTLDNNGALKSLTLSCSATGACKCGGTARLVYDTKTVSPGNGAGGRETGTLVATSPEGTVTLRVQGKRSALGAGAGTWTLGKVTGYKGVSLAPHGTYTASVKTVSAVTGTMVTNVRITAAFGCWDCTGS